MRGGEEEGEERKVGKRGVRGERTMGEEEGDKEKIKE